MLLRANLQPSENGTIHERTEDDFTVSIASCRDF